MCREPSRRGPARGGGGLHERNIFASGTYRNGCGAGCVQPAVIRACPNPGIYSNYNPRDGSFRQKQGTEAPGRGTQGYSGTATPIAGFGSRYRTKDGRAVLIKDSSAPGPPWKFIRSECVTGRRIG